MENLLKIEDIAIEKANKYGLEMVEKIKNFCRDKEAKTDVIPSQVVVTAKVIDLLCVPCGVTSTSSQKKKVSHLLVVAGC